MQFETKGKLLQLKDDYIRNVTVTNTTAVTKGPSDFESKEYTHSMLTLNSKILG